jgi:lysine 2,3-aminomutase
MLRLSPEERRALKGGNGSLPLSITPHYASLLDPDDPRQPLRRTVVAVPDENASGPGEFADPLHEERDSPVPGIVHRYPDRVVFLATAFCPVYCRYCTRSRMVGRPGCAAGRPHWPRALDYIAANPAIRDVLISGGDPLTLSDDNLANLLGRLAAIPHVEFVRIGTKSPAVLPQRITPGLVDALTRHRIVWLSLHFTHPDELTPQTAEACNRLADAGIPLGSQTVLLAGVNDDAAILKKLFHGLLRIRVRPYYLYQCDPIPGSSHFRVPVARALEIVRQLRGYTSGYAVPTYVIDAPGGGGKIPLFPGANLQRDGDYLLLQNFEGRTFRYYDPCLTRADGAGTVALWARGVNGASAVPAVRRTPRLIGDTRPALTVGITYDLREEYLRDGYSELETAELDSVVTIDAIADALESLGFRPERIGHVRQLVRRLAAGERWDLVFNLAEGMHGMGREAQVPALLDAFRIPHTFSDAAVLALALDKAKTKQVVRDLGVATPEFVVARGCADLDALTLGWPVFAKPISGGSSAGISAASLARNRRQLGAACERLWALFGQPVLVESFLPGREFTVGVVGTGENARTLGVMEILLKSGAETGMYSYANKQNYERDVGYRLVAGVIAAQAGEVALRVWRGLGCRDAGRVDLRCDAEGRLHFLEVNPLAGLHPRDSDLVILCRILGIRHRQLIAMIMASALERIPARDGAGGRSVSGAGQRRAAG